MTKCDRKPNDTCNYRILDNDKFTNKAGIKIVPNNAHGCLISSETSEYRPKVTIMNSQNDAIKNKSSVGGANDVIVGTGECSDKNLQSTENSNKNGKEIVNNKTCIQQMNGKKEVHTVDELPDEEEYELVPPDGGWGWLILVGSMMVNILVPGTVKSFGVLFVEFLEVFDATASEAAWIPALCYFLYSSLGPLSSILSVKYSYRTVTILGGAFAAVGMMLSFFAQSVTHLYVTYGFLVGTGAGLSFPPTVYIVTSYFVRLRGLANGLCISGSAIGSIILPPILIILLNTYGYRGAILIMGAVTLNVWVGAIFYHPVEKHMKKVYKTVLQSDVVIDQKDGTNKNVDNPSEVNGDLKEGKLIESSINSERFIRSTSSTIMPKHKMNRCRKISSPMPEDTPNNCLTSQIRSTPALHSVSEKTKNSMDYFSQNQLPPSRLKPPHRSPSTSSFNYVSTPYHGSTLSALQPEEFASSLTLKSLSFNPVTTFCKESENTQPQNRNKYFDVTLLKDPTYLVILISNSTNAISYTNFIILLPAYAIQLGYDKSSAASLISIVSALDLVGRIGGSALSDVGLIPKQWYFIGGLLISGISLALLPFAKSYEILCVFCSTFGLASGVYVGITAVIMADMLGTERLTSTYGISLFVNGILQLIGPPLCGVLYEQINTYGPLFTGLGIILIIGASIWGFIPFINRHKNAKNIEDYQEKQPLQD